MNERFVEHVKLPYIVKGAVPLAQYCHIVSAPGVSNGYFAALPGDT